MKNYKVFEDKTKKMVIFHDLCKGCGICIEKCPKKAIFFSKKDSGYFGTPTVEVDLKKCNNCGICEVVCPDSAIKTGK